MSTTHAHLQHLKGKEREEKCRKAAPTKFPLISSTDGRTDRPILTLAGKSTSIGIAVNQRHLVL